MPIFAHFRASFFGKSFASKISKNTDKINQYYLRHEECVYDKGIRGAGIQGLGPGSSIMWLTAKWTAKWLRAEQELFKEPSRPRSKLTPHLYNLYFVLLHGGGGGGGGGAHTPPTLSHSSLPWPYGHMLPVPPPPPPPPPH